jgi:uncharacterized protein YebE (UPF0316 family)
MDWMVLAISLLIVFARVLDVTLGTLRTTMVVSGRRAWSFVLGFIEVLIWITVVRQILVSFDHPLYNVAYALGFATGTFLGITVEQRLAFGTQVVRVFSRKGHEVATALRAAGIGEELPQLAVTEMEARGHKGPVGVLLVEVPRRFAERVAAKAVALDPDAYFVIDDVRRASSASGRAHRPGSFLARLVDRK